MTDKNHCITWKEKLLRNIWKKKSLLESPDMGKTYHNLLLYTLEYEGKKHPTWKEKIRYKISRKLLSRYERILPGIVDNEILFCSRAAQEKSDKGKPLKILIDNSVIAQFSFLFRTIGYKRVISGWPRPESPPIQMDCISMDPVYTEYAGKPLDYNREYNMRFVPSLLYLFQQEYIEIFSSDALFAERRNQMTGMYSGIGIFDYALFKDIKFKNLDGFEAYCFIDDALEEIDGKIGFSLDFAAKNPTIAHFPNAEECMGEYGMIIKSTDRDPFGTAPNASQKLDLWLKKKRGGNPDFDRLVKCLGEKNIKDAWHIYTADKYGMNFFLTMDFKIVKTIQSQKGNKDIKGLKVQVVTPQMLGEMIEIQPMRKGTFQVLHKNTILQDDSQTKYTQA